MADRLSKSTSQSKNYGSVTESGKQEGKTKNEKNRTPFCEYITDPHYWPYQCIFLLLQCYLYFSFYYCADNQGGLEDAIIKVMKVDTTQYSLLLFMYSWPNVIFCLIGGVMVDRVLGQRLSLILVATLTTLGQFLMALGAFLGHFWLMLVGRILIGIGTEINDVINVSFASKRRNVTLRLSIYYTADRLGGSSALALPQYIYESLSFLSNPHYRLGTTLLVGVVLMIVAMAFTLIIAFMDIREDRIFQRERTKMSMIRCSHLKSFSFPFWLSLAMIAIYIPAVFTYATVGQVFYIQKFDLSPVASGIADSMLFGSTLVISPLVGFLISVVGYHSSWAILGVLTALAAHLTLLISGQQSFIPYVAGVIYSTSYSIAIPSLYTIPCIFIEPSQTSTAYGFVHCAYNLMMSLLSVVTGLLVDYAGYFMLQLMFSLLLYINLMISIYLWMNYSSSDLNKLDKKEVKQKQEQKNLLEKDT